MASAYSSSSLNSALLKRAGLSFLKILLKVLFIVVIVCVICVFECVWLHARAHMWTPKDYFQEAVAHSCSGFWESNSGYQVCTTNAFSCGAILLDS